MYITLRIDGTSPGPYNIYYNSVNPTTLVATDISLATLTRGYSVEVPYNATQAIILNKVASCGT